MAKSIRIIILLMTCLLLLSSACSLPINIGGSSQPITTPTSAYPVEVFGCMAPRDCPGVTLVSRLFEEGKTLELNTEYPATIPPETQLWMSYLWCAIDQATLDDNLKKMEFDLTVDGNSYIGSLQKEYFTVPTPEDLNIKEYCYGVGGAIKGWQVGHTYRVVFGPVFTSDIFDGWDTYPAGKQQNIYILTVDANAKPVE